MLKANLALIVASLVIAAGESRATDAVPLISRVDLFGNPQKVGSEISTDGKWLSWLAPVNGVMNVWVAPADRLDQAFSVTEDKGRGIGVSAGNHDWAYDRRHFLYLDDGNGDGNTHLYAVDIEERTTRDMTPFDHVRATIVGLSPKRPDEALISLNRRDPKFADLYRVDLDTGALTLVAENPGYLGFLADDHFDPQLAIRREPSGDETVLRRSNGGWIPLTTIPAGDARTTSLLAIKADGKSLFALDSRERNTVALVRIDVTTGERTILAQDPRADIRDVILDQDTHEPVAYSVMVERLEHRALMRKLQADLDFLATRIPGDWTLNSRSRDDRYWKMTVQTSARMLAYLYDRKLKSVTQLYDPRPGLVSAPLVDMRPVTIKSRDGLDLVSYLSLPKGSDSKRAGIPDTPVPLVLVLHGGPHNRNSFGFSAVHQWLANRGYAALSVNMRGSTGFGKAFTNASSGAWGTKMDDDLLDAVGWAIRSKIADPARIAIMGGSYGGYAVLRGLTRDAGTYACGIDLYGFADLIELGPTTYGFSALNHNEIGDPSTPDGRERMREQSPLYQADRIRKPLLVGQGANDPGVNQSQSDRMVAAVKAVGVPVTYLLYPDEGHGFQRAQNNLSFYAVAEQFLAQCLGGRAESLTAADLAGSSMQVLEGADHIPGLRAALANQAVSASASAPK